MRSFSLAVVLCCCSHVAGQSVLTPADRAIAAQAKGLRESVAEGHLPVNPHEEGARSEAMQLLSALKDQHAAQLALPEITGSGGRILIFASHSLGEASLDDIFHMASTTPEAVVVFRGIVDEAHFAESVMALQQRAARQSPVANVVIDPTLYRDHHVSTVPTILYLSEDRHDEVARVAGLSHPRWLLDKVTHGGTGDFGIRGPVETILERDLVEVMQEKMAGIDWAAKKTQAIERYWQQQRFIHLPRAPQARVRHLDPSIRITADIVDADGQVLIPRGTRFNPLDLHPFTQAVVVFDPLDAVQIAWVDARLPLLRAHYTRVTLVVTRFDRTDGWQSYRSVTDHFDAPVFKLTPELQSRFELHYTPSIVSAQQRHFVIEELAGTVPEAALASRGGGDAS